MLSAVSRYRKGMKRKYVINTLLERRNFLLEFVESLKKQRYFHDGSFALREMRGKVVAYRRFPDSIGNGEYLGKNKRDIAVELARKDRDKKMLTAAFEEIQGIDHAIRILKGCKDPDDVYDSLPVIQQNLIGPTDIDHEYAKRWEDDEYQGNPREVLHPYTTMKGEVVRSKSEKMIADGLFVKEIPYRYEYPHRFKGYGTRYPDFTILNVRTHEEIIWEHFGKMDKPDYCAEALGKLELYSRFGYSQKRNLIITQESSEKPFDPGFWIDRLIKEYLI